jgi:hypothetical protein
VSLSTSSSTGISANATGLASLSTSIDPLVNASKAATATGATVLGTTVGGGVDGIVQTYGASGNTLTTVNAVGMTKANGVDSTASGVGAQSQGTGATAYGAYASAQGQNTTAIGYRSVANMAGSVAIGNNARATGDPTVAIGDNSLASGNNSVAVGASAQATADGAVALGAGSVAGQPNTVSVGTPGSERRITNVAPGINATDAVNVSQLNENSRVAYAGIAMSFALSGVTMPPLDPGEMGIGVGLGYYKGSSAVGVSFKALNKAGNMSWGAGVSSTGREWGLQVGVGFKWR